MEEHESFEPPLEEAVIALLQESSSESENNGQHPQTDSSMLLSYENQQVNDLPLIDISHLDLEEGHPERDECEMKIAQAARDWGFFQVVNHGIQGEVLEQMMRQEKRLFRQPFTSKKAGGGKTFELGKESYRWGNPAATYLRHISWSEAFSIPITEISKIEDESLRSVMETFVTVASALVEKIAVVLAVNLGAVGAKDYFRENCTRDSYILRLNRYPACPNYSSKVFGLVPHTDSDFLTIVFQDIVGGLQLMKDDGSWANVSPNPNALVINVGDLLQAWSNGLYRSVKHRVMANPETERHSTAFFYCPKSDTVIQSCIYPSIYRQFSYREYRLQVQEDVRATGDKVGLSRFLLSSDDSKNVYNNKEELSN